MLQLSLLQPLEARQVREIHDLESIYQHGRHDRTTSTRLADQSETAAVRPMTTHLISMRAAHYYARRSLLCALPHYARWFMIRAGALYTPVHARGSSTESVHVWTSYIPYLTANYYIFLESAHH